MGSRITLGSNAGTDLTNLDSGALGWSPAQVTKVTELSTAMAQGQGVNPELFDECLTLLRNASDGSPSSTIGQVVEHLCAQASTDYLKLRVLGFFLDQPSIAMHVLEVEPSFATTLGHLAEPLGNLAQLPNGPGWLDTVRLLVHREAVLPPRIDTSFLEAEGKREESPMDDGDRALDNALHSQDAEALWTIIDNAARAGTLDKLASALVTYPQAKVLRILGALANNPALTGPSGQQLAFDLTLDVQSRFASSSAALTSPGEPARSLADMTRGDLEQLLLSPAPMVSAATDYYPPAYCSHMLGLLAEG